MAISRDKYIGKFIDEALDNIGTVEGLIFEIRDGVSVEDDLATLLRALHTLKGSSRMLEFKRVERLSHSLENVFIALKEQRINLSDAGVKLVMAALDTLREGIGVVRDTKDDDIDTAFFDRELAAMAVNEDFTLPKGKGGAPAEPRAAEKRTAPEAALPLPGQGEQEGQGEQADPAGQNGPAGGIVQAGEAAGGPVPSGEGSPAPQSGPGDAPRGLDKPRAETIRLSLEKVDGIVKSAAALQSLEISANAIEGEYALLHGMVKNFAAAVKADRSLASVLTADVRRLEKLSAKLNTALKNHAAEAAGRTRDLYDSVITLRMLPISSILDVYPRYVFELAQEMGKKVQLSIEGKENEIDKNIIEVLKEVFLHMVRNAIDHGIEGPGERKAAGKDETGRLGIRCFRESGSMKIVVADDGRGIDHEKIRRRLLEQGYVSPEAAASLSREELTNYIFQSGFSTSAGVSNISGRGVGMDVVRSNVERLKGSVTVESETGRGTMFTIVVPLSIAALMGFPVSCGDMKFIIPAGFVTTILLLKREQVITVVDRPQIRYENRIIKLYYLDQILEIKGRSSSGDTILVVIIRAYEDEIALVVDTAASMRTVILKPMPAFLQAKSVFSGMVLGEDYEMSAALHMPTVIRMARRIKGISMKKRDLESKNFRKAILVVDDSLPTREIESDILSSEGYRVDTAADGVEALAMAKANRYDLVCTDLNMPQMDGFMLTENIKKNSELQGIPVIVISSRSDEEDQKRAAMLGASRYIVKNSFNNHNLLAAVHELIGASDE